MKKKLPNPKFLQSLLQHRALVEFVGKMPTVKQLFFSVLGGVLLGFLFLSLLSYDSGDPAWSHISTREHITNITGKLGAWVSDILQLFFGFGAWWLTIVICYEMMRLWWKKTEHLAWQLRFISYTFLMMFVSGLLAQLGATKSTSHALKFGGVVGLELHKGLVAVMGMIGATLFLLVMLLLVITLVVGIDWKKIFGLDKLVNTQTPPTSETPPVQATKPTEQSLFEVTPTHIPQYHYNNQRALEEFLTTSGLRNHNFGEHDPRHEPDKDLSTPISNVGANGLYQGDIEQPDDRQATHYHDTHGIGVTYVPTNIRINQEPTSKPATPKADLTQYRPPEIVQETPAQVSDTPDVLYYDDSPELNAIMTPAVEPEFPTVQIEPTPSVEPVKPVAPKVPSVATTTAFDDFVIPENTQSTDNKPIEVAPQKPDITSETTKSYALDVLKYRQSLSPIPPLSILDEVPPKTVIYTEQELKQLSELLEIKLQEFNVTGTVVNATVGPVVTRFEVDLAPGIKASRVTKISQDLARSMSMPSVRVIPIIAGKPYIGIEVPNRHRQIVSLLELLDTPDYQDPNAGISIAVGSDIEGKPVIADLAAAPHMLVAGTTGSGKSVLVNSFLLSMILKYTPDQLRLVLIDPKQLELANYGDIPHLLTPVITDMNEATAVLNWCVEEMERRYHLMSLLKVRQLSEFNKKIDLAKAQGNPIIDPLWSPNDSVSVSSAPDLKPLSKIVVVADEFADMIMQLGKTAEEPIVRLAQKSRAAGIHLILATQRPVATVVTGLIKSNIPSRVALRVNSTVDSRVILDEGGAEDMLGHGDMMFIAPKKNYAERVHGAFVKDDEVNRVTDAWRERGTPDYIDLSQNYSFDGEGSANESSSLGNSDEDDYNQAVAFFMETRKVSISSLQRKLSIGFNKAARLVDMMEERGVVSPADNSNKRQLLI